MLRVVRGGFEPANALEQARLRERKYQVGDIVSAEIRKPRNPAHHALVMTLLSRLVENSDELLTVDQLLTTVKIRLGYAAPYVDASTLKTFWVVESIAFENMEQGAFEVFWKALCELVRRDFWPHLSAEEIAEQARMMDPSP